MSGFQIVVLILLALLFVGNVSVVLRGQVSRRAGLPWAAVWLLAGGAVIWPSSTRLIARVLGIGRGADLVLYCFVLVALIGFYMTYVRLRRLNADLTQLVRHLAIQNTVTPDRDTGTADAARNEAQAG